MSMMNLALNLPEDISLYTPFRSIGTVTPVINTFTTLTSISGKGYLQLAMLSVFSMTYTTELRVTIDGSVYDWGKMTAQGNNDIAFGIFDDDMLCLSSTTYAQVRYVGNANIGLQSLYSTFRKRSTTVTEGTWMNNTLIPFNSSLLVEVRNNISMSTKYEVYGFSK